VIGDARLDHAFAHLDRDEKGLARIELRRGRETIGLWLDSGFDFVQVYTGDTLPERARRRASVAVEPMSCAPDAFNSGDGLRVLNPGEMLEGRWSVAAG
jgi:aldose 1-epimerase